MAETATTASRHEIRLDGRVAIVTGAARGLGKAMALGLAHAGAKVVFADISADVLTSAVAEVENKPRTGATAAMVCDITNKESCEALVAETVARFGALHVLVNNAAKGPVHLERSPRTKSLKF